MNASADDHADDHADDLKTPPTDRTYQGNR